MNRNDRRAWLEDKNVALACHCHESQHSHHKSHAPTIGMLHLFKIVQRRVFVLSIQTSVSSYISSLPTPLIILPIDNRRLNDKQLLSHAKRLQVLILARPPLMRTKIQARLSLSAFR